MNFKELPKGMLYTLRGLGIVSLPFAVMALAALIFWPLATLAAKMNVFLDGEAVFMGVFPLIIVLWVSLGLKWSGKKQVAKKLVAASLVIFTLVFAASSAASTFNTKPIMNVAAGFEVPADMTRKMTENSDSFSPALGLFPCVNLEATGCPHIKRGWVADEGKELGKADLVKIIEDSGWSDVKIQEDNCNLTNDKGGRYISCYAEGIVDDYKATVGITKVSDEWELRLYVRESHVR